MALIPERLNYLNAYIENIDKAVINISEVHFNRKSFLLKKKHDFQFVIITVNFVCIILKKG